MSIACTPATSVIEINATRITPLKALEMMETYDNLIIIDVRNPWEFEEGHIPGAINLPQGYILEQAFMLIPDFDQLILVYCRSGIRSADASKVLAGLGFKNVYDFGGILDWVGDIVTFTEFE